LINITFIRTKNGMINTNKYTGHIERKLNVFHRVTAKSVDLIQNDSLYTTSIA